MQLLKEPLLHFILIGTVLFGVYSVINRPDSSSTIIISREDIETLGSRFSNDWNRAASDGELEILIADLVREELAVREGYKLELDDGDPVVRQRIRQKLELMVEEGAVVGEPSENELALYLKENSDLFRNRDGSVPQLNEIRNLVIFEWENSLRIEQLDQFYNELKAKYGVEVEGKPE